MRAGFGGRRGAEEFHQAVERSRDGARAGTDVPAAELLELVAQLRAVEPVAPRPDFSADLRARLMSEAATVLTPTAAKLSLNARPATAAPVRRERRLAVLVGGFAVASAATSMAVASQGALPGDTLYPLKRALEDTSTTIRVDDADRAGSLLAHADVRLAEVEELASEGRADDPEVVAETLAVFAEQATDASALAIRTYEADGDEAGIEQLRDFTSSAMQRLRGLEDVVPTSARGALLTAASVLTGIDETAATLCPGCGPGLAQVPTAAVTPIEDVLGELGEAIDPPVAAPAEPTRPARPQSDQPREPRETPQQGEPGEASSEPASDGTPVDVDPPRTPTTPEVRNPIRDLAEGLSGGREGRTRTGGLGTVLDETLGNVGEGVGDVLGGLLGPAQ